jgi:hypothetical protein
MRYMDLTYLIVNDLGDHPLHPSKVAERHALEECLEVHGVEQGAQCYQRQLQWPTSWVT